MLAWCAHIVSSTPSSSSVSSLCIVECEYRSDEVHCAPTFCLFFNCYQRPSYSSSQNTEIYQNTYTNTGHHNVMIVNPSG
ncbi:hypothetical protein SFRURICE_000709 [Spodoptera frugiperda]|nr:hypothetical protein SFRURICE_000709 [Spodoptera frugiperda]